MSSDNDVFDEFWTLFGSELDEYLTAIETILAASPVDPGRVDELFRAFHSVKGGAAALAMRCVETVAHAAEDVLHLVRAGRRELSTDLVSALLEAVDEMRRLQGTAMAARKDQPVNDAIVARLKAHLGAAPVAASAPIVVAAPATPVTVPLAATPKPPSGPALDLDGDALAAVQDAVLGLIGAVDGDEPADAALALAEAATAAALPGVAGAAQRLAAAGGTAGAGWAWLDLVLRLRGLDAASGESVGASALAAALEVRLAELLLEHVGTLKSAPADPAVWLHAARLLAGLDLEAGVELADLVASRLLLDGAVADEDDLADLFALVGISISSGMDAPLEEIAALRDARFAAAGLAPTPDDASPAVEGTSHPWPAELPKRLAEEVEAGRAPALVLVDLETDPHAVDAVTEILYAARCLHNRSRLDLGGLFEYAVALEEPVAAFAQRLADADPARACLRSVRATDAMAVPGDEALPGAAPPAAPAQAVPAPAAPAADTAPAAQAVPQPAAASASAPARPADTVVRVPSGAIDSFMDLIGELRLGLTSLSLAMGEDAADGAGATGTAARAAQDELHRLERAVRSLYDGAIALRVVPIGTLFSRLLRPIRDTAVQVGKDVALTTTGEDVQVDKAMVEMLVDPLTHIVRNSVDHGIEAPERRIAAGKPRGGSIRIGARQATSLAVIEVEDDGAGIDVARVREKAVAKGLIGAAEAAALSDGEAVQLILLPGFSTRDEVTATSGRGVGMDIVVTAIKKLGGRLTIDNRPGAGTRMTIEFPVSAAMQRVLVAEAGGQSFAVHERAVREVIEIPPDSLQRVGRRLTVSLRARFLPVVDLAAVLGLGETETGTGRKVVIVVDDGQSQLGLLIERLAVRREVFFKRLHPLIERNPLIAGAAVIGAGSVLFALDTQALFAHAARWLEPEDSCSAK